MSVRPAWFMSTVACWIAGAEQAVRANGRIGAFDAHHFRLAEHGNMTDQMCGGVADHHSARRRGRFHPLGHPDVHADRGVTPEPESMSPAMTWPEFRPMRSRSSMPSRLRASSASQ